jgi:signal transduction histidine kinase
VLVALIIVVIGAAVLVVLISRRLRRQRDHEHRLYELSVAQEQHLEHQLVEAGERGRIAAELYDVIVLQLEALGRSEDPEARRIAQDASGELRRLRAVLNVGDDPTPPNALDELPALVERIRAGAGLPVTLNVDGQRRLVPPSLEASAYRVVQDALAHIVEQDGDAPTSVRVVWRPNVLGVQVRVASRIERDGLDTLALEQRVALYDGALRAGPSGSGFEVTATLPLP